ncbi:MAG TPA: type II toxin-antitoxin system prevent-host-death family antitoxin [Polyangia bacterium]|nr:type II toxin-antitoxin system prevent-host-death family antitoxin [Polyangia bacterium]
MNIDGAATLSITAFRRGLTHWLDRLERGESDKLVVVKNGQPQAVVLTPAAYEKLKADD